MSVIHAHSRSLLFNGSVHDFAERHNMLYVYFKKLAGQDFQSFKIEEASCSEDSCPVIETYFTIIAEDGNKLELSVPRSLNSISKMDLHLAAGKQWQHG